MAYEGMIAESVTIRGNYDEEIEAYYARPLGGGPFPGVVLIHHMPGWDEWTREVVRKLAHHGYATISPHLYSRYGPGSPDDAAAKARAAGGMRDDEVMGDVAGALRFLRGQPYASGKVGVIGFCSGGRHTYLVACRLPDIDAAVDCWGGGVVVDDTRQLNAMRPVAPIDLTENLCCPLLSVILQHTLLPGPSPAQLLFLSTPAPPPPRPGPQRLTPPPPHSRRQRQPATGDWAVEQPRRSPRGGGGSRG